MLRTILLVSILVLGSFYGRALAAVEEKWPTQPIEVIVGFTPGSTSDLVARLYAPILSKDLGVPVVVVNKPGGAAAVAGEYVARAKPDGYTILENSFNVQAWRPHTQHVKYTLHDFTYILSHSDYHFSFLVRSDAPWKRFKDWVEYARKNPGSVKYGSPGIYTTPGTAMEEVIRRENIKVLHIPFKGDGESNTALLGGHVDMGGGAGAGVPLIEGGKIRSLLQLSGELVDKEKVETLGEVYPDFPKDLKLGIEMPRGLVGPKGMPAPIVQKLSKSLKKTTETEEFRKMMRQLGSKIVVWESDQIYKNVQIASQGMARFLKETGFVKK
jgi:tripartite-type tricarboxylate transporter receptor subunit TctC